MRRLEREEKQSFANRLRGIWRFVVFLVPILIGVAIRFLSSSSQTDDPNAYIARREQKADVLQTNEYSEGGLSLRYPGNWLLRDGECVVPRWEPLCTAGACMSRRVFVQSPGWTTVAIIRCLEDHAESVEDFLIPGGERLTREIEDIQKHVLGATHAGKGRYFDPVDDTGHVLYYWAGFEIRDGDRVTFVVIVTNRGDWNHVQPGIDLVLNSLRLNRVAGDL